MSDLRLSRRVMKIRGDIGSSCLVLLFYGTILLFLYLLLQPVLHFAVCFRVRMSRISDKIDKCLLNYRNFGGHILSGLSASQGANWDRGSSNYLDYAMCKY